jgi:hypothetical protein
VSFDDRAVLDNNDRILAGLVGPSVDQLAAAQRDLLASLGGQGRKGQEKGGDQDPQKRSYTVWHWTPQPIRRG